MMQSSSSDLESMVGFFVVDEKQVSKSKKEKEAISDSKAKRDTSEPKTAKNTTKKANGSANGVADEHHIAHAVTENHEADDADWKEFNLDLSVIPIEDDIRIAFVFINGNGNDLYIDDISIRGNEPPEYSRSFKVFPNPIRSDTRTFNLGFNLSEKQKVEIELINMSGKIMVRQEITNALNQILTVESPIHPGLYFVRVSGNNFVETQKLFISR